MAKGDIVELTIEGTAAGGAGVGRADGKAVFVEGAARGDVLAARIFEEKATWAKAELVKLLEPSPKRVEPVCPLYGSCGGCSLQHLSYEAQLEEKTALLKDHFSRIGRFEAIPVLDVVASAPFEYRNRMQFHRAAPEKSRGGPRVGFMPKAGDRVVGVADCPVADPGIRAALAAGELVSPPWTDRFNVYSREGVFLAEGGQACGRSVSGERGVVDVAGKALAMDVKGFFQSNGGVLDALAQRVRVEAVASGEGRALDLYCGIGTFGAFLRDRYEKIDLVERDRTTLALARENVKGGGVRHFALSDDDWAKRPESRAEPYAFAVTDPPRTGLSGAVKAWLIERRPAKLCYVSCDGATLARDARELAASAYDLKSLTYYDFYPQTAHLEALAVFEART